MPPSDSASSSGTAVNTPSSSSPSPSPLTPARSATPKLRLEIRDLAHPGAASFLSAITASAVLQSAVSSVLSLLYETRENPTSTRSVTLVLREKPGVAYTVGTELDSDHKEIHFSLGYISRIQEGRVRDEITGVLVHELVHCFQYNGKGTCPSGLIEGLADWVRLRCHLANPPPHWKRDTSKGWDAGYERTAYFLEYLEGRFGVGTVRRVNAALREEKYVEDTFWPRLFGRSVKELWAEYCGEVEGKARA
ncbi:hypothetical protein VUR80DRAFT_9739 [Thermomyces stellatus]